MKREIPIRIRIHKPLAGVKMQVQRGKDELLPSTEVLADSIAFDFDITVDLASVVPNFLGKYTQGPKDARFIYVNSGTYAGQEDTCWARRAKISLMSVTRQQVEELLALQGKVLETSFNGTGGRDVGPTCATVKGIEWKVVKK